MDPDYRDRAVYVDGTLVLADLHFGKGAASSVEFPIGAGEDCAERLTSLLEHFEPEEVVLAGDVFHSFDYVPDSAEDALSLVSEAVRDAGARLVVVEGNHDTMLDSAYAGDLHAEYVLETEGTETVVVTHGHEEPERTADSYIVGHDHPAIEIEGQKRPCFLVGGGAYRRSDVFVLPPFNRLVEGLSVNGRLGGSRPELSPLVTRVSQFRPVVYDEESEETLTFPPLGQFSRML
ncbi:metallophosphoesterase [Halosimplex salinum]|uniref:metallophosphoesterase n=1 Tax=Halosimplex salinum TaxID=1710538 RepID=UPI000F49880D|nr:metallophosphoesterase [Halosimplex salinum]